MFKFCPKDGGELNSFEPGELTKALVHYVGEVTSWESCPKCYAEYAIFGKGLGDPSDEGGPALVKVED